MLQTVVDLFYQFRAGQGFGIHRNEVVHFISPVDVEELTGRSHAVGGIYIPPVFFIEIQPPVALIGRPEFFQVVDIRTFDMEDITEQSMLGHIQGGKFEKVVYAVFQHHTVLAGLFGSIDQLPAFIEIHGCGDFDGDMFTVFHGVNGYGSMQQPRSDDIYQIDIGAFTKLFPAFFSTIGGSLGTIVFGEDLLGFFYPLGIKVTEGFDGSTFDLGKTIDGPRAAHA